MKPIKILLLGLGNMGRHHLKAIQSDPGFELVGIVDPELIQMPQNAAGSQMFKTLDETAHLDFDAAIVAAPTTFHAQLVDALLERGKHVLVEKPAASTLVEATKLVAKAKDLNLKLAVGHIERCNPALDALATILQAGLIGVPVHVAATRCGAYPRSLIPGNQVFLDLAVHELDVLVRLFRNLHVKDGFYHCLQDEKIPDLAEVRLEFGQGGQATIHVNWLTPQKIRDLRVTGTQGVLELDYISQTLRIFGHSLPDIEHLGLEYHVKEHPFCEYAEVNVGRGEPIRRQLREFHQMICGKDHILCTDEGILESLRLLDECFEKTKNMLSPNTPGFLKAPTHAVTKLH